MGTENASAPTPSLGVVVAAWNAERWIGATLDSLTSQSYQRWECVVVDDGSTDGTAAAVLAHSAADPRVRLVRRPNGGPSAARNTGLAALHPSTSLVTFLDADDLYAEHGLEVLVTSLAHRPDAVGVIGLAEYCDEEGRPRDPGLHPTRQRDRRRWSGRRLLPLAPGADSTFADLVEYSPGWPSLAVVLREEHVREVGGFDEALALREDWDLHLRLSRRGPFAVVDDQVAWYRRHGANLTRSLLTGQMMHGRVIAKAYDDTGNDAVQRDILRRSALRRHLVLVRTVAACLGVAVRDRRPAAALRVGAALVWTLTTALRLRPAPPSHRFTWWAHGLRDDAPDQSWHG